MNIFLILNLVIVVVSVSGIDPRIIKGKNAVERQFPYQVGISLTKDGENFTWCGGALIDSSWIVTAAHCTKGAIYANIYLGSTDRSKPRVEITVNSDDITEHEAYDARYTVNDIALIKIPAVTFDAYIQKVNLPAISSNYPSFVGKHVMTSGWGKTSDSPNSGVVNNLQYTTMVVVDNIFCEQTYGSNTVKQSTLCVAPIKGSSTCHGDSGGPLVLTGSKILIGITSFGPSSGCEGGKYFGFTRVTSYLPWIKRITKLSF